MSDRLEVECPCCNTVLIVDKKTAEVLSETRPERDLDKSFDGAMNQVRGGAKRREDAFEKAFTKTQNLEDILEKKFEEASKKAAKDKSKPINPLDFE